MKKSSVIILLVLCLSVSASKFAYTQWYEITAYDSIYVDLQFYRKIQFVNSSTGYLIGGPHNNLGLFQKSTDGGLTWKSYPASNINSTRFWLDMQFLDELTGFVTGFSNNIFKTTDGGLIWNSIAVAEPTQAYHRIESIYFVNHSTGFLYGSPLDVGSKYRKTTDGGESWTELEGTTHLNGLIKFINKDTGFIYGSSLYRTTNRGEKWQYVNNVNSVTSISFVNNNTGFLITGQGSNKNLGKTTDAGLTWSLTGLQVQHDLHNVTFLNETTGLCSDLT